MDGRWTRNGVLATALGVVLLVVGLAPATAGPRDRQLAQLNTRLWHAILAAPLDEANPYTTAGCLRLGRTTAPFEGGGIPEFSCYVEPGAPVLVSGYSLEQSAVEEPGSDDSEATLRASALRILDARPVPTVRLDGRPLHLVRVAGDLASVDLPDPNLLGTPLPRTTFVAAGLITLVRPGRGCHAITIKTPPDPATEGSTTTYVTTYLQVGRRTDCHLPDANPR